MIIKKDTGLKSFVLSLTYNYAQNQHIEEPL